MTKNDQNDPDQQFFEGCTHDLDKVASSAFIVATAMDPRIENTCILVLGQSPN